MARDLADGAAFSVGGHPQRRNQRRKRSHPRRSKASERASRAESLALKPAAYRHGRQLMAGRLPKRAPSSVSGKTQRSNTRSPPSRGRRLSARVGCGSSCIATRGSRSSRLYGWSKSGWAPACRRRIQGFSMRARTSKGAIWPVHTEIRSRRCDGGWRHRPSRTGKGYLRPRPRRQNARAADVGRRSCARSRKQATVRRCVKPRFRSRAAMRSARSRHSW